MTQASCPLCKRSLDASSSEAFPFCSKRCKVIDLGAWLDGSYRIAGTPLSDDIDEELLAKLTSHDGGDA